MNPEPNPEISIATPSAPVPPSVDPKKVRRGCLALCAFVGSLIFLWIVMAVTDDSPSSESKHHTLSRSEWISASGMYRGGQNSVLQTKALYSAVGQPAHIQVVGDSVYLYWECGDGQIQVTANRYMFENEGQVVGTYNLY